MLIAKAPELPLYFLQPSLFALQNPIFRQILLTKNVFPLQQVRTSVLTVFHNRAEDAESILTAVYELISGQDELIIIDDASTDETADIIASVVEHANHDNTIFLQNEEQRGRGVALQQAWELRNGDIVWIVGKTPNIDAEILDAAVHLVTESNAVSVIMGSFIVPKDIAGWLRVLDDGSLPCDTNFLWNVSHFPANQKFTSPYWNKFYATELALRLYNKGHFITAETNSSIQRQPIGTMEKKQFLLQLLTKSALSQDSFDIISQRYRELLLPVNQGQGDIDSNSILEQARTFHQEGNNAAALEKLDEILQAQSGNQEAKNLKVQILNKMRRYVEAAELKHNLKTDTSKQEAEPALTENNPEEPEESATLPEEDMISDPVSSEISLSVIIPAAGIAQERTMSCLKALFEYEHDRITEVILLDNATLDETVDEVRNTYGDKVTIIRNENNPGFGVSVNSALNQAQGEYCAVLHNDVRLESNVLTRLCQYLDKHEDYGLLAPMAEASLNALQLLDSREQFQNELEQVEYVDSFCMVFRNLPEIRFDGNFGLAFFEDMDFAYQLREEGLKTGIIPDLKVSHEFGSTLREIGLNLLEKEYWKNLAYFNKKWHMEPSINEEFLQMPKIQQLITIGQSINVLYPEQHLVDYVVEALDSELKTSILAEKFSWPDLNAMIRLMMAIDQRDILRRLEEMLDEQNQEPDRELFQFLITYYFDRNIYSRCKKYITEFPNERLPFAFRLYKTRIAINERDLDLAADLIASLGKERPAHPDLHYLAGELCELQGQEQEAVEYKESAMQINPFRFQDE